MAYAFNNDKSKFDLNETLDNVDSIAGSLATIEVSPAITNHSTGEYIMYNGTLLKVLSPIATGENLVLGTNVTPINFGNEVKTLQDSVGNCAALRYDQSAKATVIEVLNDNVNHTRLVLWDETQKIQYQKLINGSWTNVFTK